MLTAYKTNATTTSTRPTQNIHIMSSNLAMMYAPTTVTGAAARTPQ